MPSASAAPWAQQNYRRNRASSLPLNLDNPKSGSAMKNAVLLSRKGLNNAVRHERSGHSGSLAIGSKLWKARREERDFRRSQSQEENARFLGTLGRACVSLIRFRGCTCASRLMVRDRTVHPAVATFPRFDQFNQSVTFSPRSSTSSVAPYQRSTSPEGPLSGQPRVRTHRHPPPGLLI